MEHETILYHRQPSHGKKLLETKAWSSDKTIPKVLFETHLHSALKQEHANYYSRYNKTVDSNQNLLCPTPLADSPDIGPSDYHLVRTRTQSLCK